MTEVKKVYHCQFCSKEFTRKRWFERHNCAKRKRFMEQNNLEMISAHRAFNHWLKQSGLGKSIKDMEGFLKSPFCESFKRLIIFCNDNHLVTPFRYIDWLIKEGLPEKLWLNKNNLPVFNEWLSRTDDVTEQCLRTKAAIHEWSVRTKIDAKDFFKRVSPGKALDMIRENSLSPWVLLGLNQSLDDLFPRFNSENLYYIEEHLNLSFWLEQVKNNPDKIDEIADVFRDWFAAAA